MALNTEQYYDRDLSWLRFNHRVLQEAKDKRNPLLERLKFLAIFSSNLDEFFKVRVSDIRKIKQIDKPLRKKLITKPNKLLAEIKQQVNKQQKQFGQIFYTELLPELKKEGVIIKSLDSFSVTDLEYIHTFYKTIAHLHKPLVTTSGTFLENETLYLVTLLKNGELVWIKINEEIKRFVTIKFAS